MNDTEKKGMSEGLRRYFEKEPVPDPEPIIFPPKPICPNPNCQSKWILWLERTRKYRCRTCGQEFVRAEEVTSKEGE